MGQISSYKRRKKKEGWMNLMMKKGKKKKETAYANTQTQLASRLALLTPKSREKKDEEEPENPH